MAEKQKPQPDIMKVAAKLLQDPQSVRLTPDLKRRSRRDVVIHRRLRRLVGRR